MDRLGIDFEEVISERKGNISIAVDGDYLVRPFVPGVIEALRRLIAERFGEHVWIISACNQASEARILHFLDHHNFWDKTGVRRENIRFCRDHGGKAPVSQKLGITHFVDDRLEVLSHLTTVPHRFALRPRQQEPSEQPFAHLASHVCIVQSWQEIVEELLPP